MVEIEEVIRAVILLALDASPELLPHGRYERFAEQQAAREQVADQIARELVCNGWLPFEVYDVTSMGNYQAVAFTMKQMRRRLLKHVRGDGRDVEAEREAMEAVATAFFTDLEERGWRLVRVREPGPRVDLRPFATGFGGGRKG